MNNHKSANDSSVNNDASSGEGERHLPRRRLRNTLVEGDSYALLLVALAALFILIPAFGGSPIGRFVSDVLISGILLLGLHTSHVRKRGWHLALVIATVNIITAAFAAVFGSWLAAVASSSSSGALLLVTPAVIVRRILSHRVVAAETILGAICVYLMIGLAFAFVYSVMGQVSDQPILLGNPEGTTPNYLYFSYVTMATLGYGDLRPATTAMQSLAVVEVLTGQLFLAIAIARLVTTFRLERVEDKAQEAKDY